MLHYNIKHIYDQLIQENQILEGFDIYSIKKKLSILVFKNIFQKHFKKYKFQKHFFNLLIKVMLQIPIHKQKQFIQIRHSQNI